MVTKQRLIPVLHYGPLHSLRGPSEQQSSKDAAHTWRQSREPSSFAPVDDDHPIKGLMHKADRAFERNDRYRSQSFKETVDKYRRQYGRHPPPGFKEWYKFARERGVYDIDAFDQIYEDLRPFWSVPPRVLRRYAAHASDDAAHGIAVVRIRRGRVSGWRSEMLESVSEWLPDMDIPINRMEEPRVVVPWEDMQVMLRVERRTRSLNESGVEDGFTQDMDCLWRPGEQDPEPQWLKSWNPFLHPEEHDTHSPTTSPDYSWFDHANKPFMDLAAKACPPESFARHPDSPSAQRTAEKGYKTELGGFTTDVNLASDLCTVGPTIAGLHDMLSAPASMLVTQKLVPVFSERKTSVNSDILFPARYEDRRGDRYDAQDIGWDDKDDMLFWRGDADNGEEQTSIIQQQRLVDMTNTTALAKTTTPILALDTITGNYTLHAFHPAPFAQNHTDVGFATSAGPSHPKYLLDIDGRSKSNPWRSILHSRSLGIEATIFKKWYTERLVGWRHYVPLDNRFDDLYSLLTYFVGLETPPLTLPRHDNEAYKLAHQGREWAAKVLRREDMDIYLFRLLLEYGRLIDDRRALIGFVGDGGAEMEEFDRRVGAVPL
ncbi:hypothetical protein LTR37_015611 [Vermiconidia calcicola]|uniref:Uncharacterized protein n=1 Tax=Vermiconidia calcicola TaxID=1690605 RepID=A0ACC3MQC2_9PEZI|nr:hypothetical protein LTR37_015611 [Vermiconidia calcicola]